MARRGRKPVQGAPRRDELYDPYRHGNLIDLLDFFEKTIEDFLTAGGNKAPRTSLRSITGFENEKLSAWRNNHKRNNPIVQAGQMLASLQATSPSSGADPKLDEAWSNRKSRQAADGLIKALTSYVELVAGGQRDTASPPGSESLSLPTRQLRPEFIQEYGVIYTRSELELIARNINVPSENDPDNPEFPPDSPRYPATPTKLCVIDGMSVLIKDESLNPTGTHKDRWAWEMIVRYKSTIQGLLLSSNDDEIVLPRYSMISSGNAAFALQTMLRSYRLPDLNVLVDSNRTSEEIKDKLLSRGARVTPINLSTRFLSEADVLDRTGNEYGIDVTTRIAGEPFVEGFYDWLCYEILLSKPKNIFLPFGTGGLFSNMTHLLHSERGGRSDRRLQAGVDSLRDINVYGATSDDPETQMHMLYAPYRPAREGIDAAVARFVAEGTLGRRSAILSVSDIDAARAAQRLRGQGVRTDLSGAASLALFLQMGPSIPTDELSLVVTTGCLHLPHRSTP